MTGGELLIQCLMAQGVKVIFGIPGNQLTPVYESLYKHQDEIQHVLGRHESSVAFMADGYARSTGNIGVCMTIPGPGASNAHVGLGEASTDCVPVLLITSQNESRFAGRETSKMFHGLDQKRALAPVTKAMASVLHAEEIPEAVTHVFSALRTGRPRPALLEISSDAIATEVDAPVPPMVSPPESGPYDTAPLAKLISKAKRPLILAGAGIHHTKAHTELQQFAEAIQAPVFTTILGKGAIPEDHPLLLGRCRSNLAHEAFDSADFLLAMGTRFTQMDTGGWSMKLPEIWAHIEADPTEIGREYEPTVGFAAPPKLILQQLLKKTLPSSSDEWQEQIRRWRKEHEGAAKPRVIDILRKAIPRDAIVSVDVHITGYAMHRHFPTYQPGTFLYPGIYVAMGYGLPAAIGAKLAHPERMVIALAGDASFMMSSMELATVAQNELPMVIILSNDNSLTSIRGSQEARFGATLGVDVRNPDFMAYAHAFGIDAIRVARQETFLPALQVALASGGPFLIELTPEVFREF